jgi:hypothetical protein
MSNQEKLTPEVEKTLGIFEEMLRDGFPIKVAQIEPGVLAFTKDEAPLQFDEMDLEAIKFYINTFVTLTNQDGGEEEAPSQEEGDT